MKKILVTGAAGSIGIHTIKYLLSEGKYEITALDLRNRNVFNRLKKFRKRINILYGDVCNRVLVESLVKDHDVIIHLASSLPPLADMKKGLSDIIDYQGTENLVRAINYYNPKCHLFYASTTSLYKDTLNPTVKTKIKLDEFDYFCKAKLKAEKLIKDKIKNYTIFRIPLVLSDLRSEPFMYHGIKDEYIDVITKEDAAYAFVRGLNFTKELNGKKYNLASGSIKYGDLLNRVLEIYGLSFKYWFNRAFIEKNWHSPSCEDNNLLNEIINYRNDTLSEYYNRLRGRSKKRKFYQTIAKPFIRDDKK